MRWLRTGRRVGASAGRHPVVALIVVAAGLHAAATACEPPAVCQRPNELQACG